MPSEKTDNLKHLSQQLHGSETPRSPRELDERIVQHARQKAEEYREYSSSAGFKWLGDTWKTTAAVFSVAVIAISVTIQVYDDSTTTSLIVSRAIPDAEVGNVESDEDVPLSLADRNLQYAAEPQPRAAELERSSQSQVTASTTDSGVTAEVTFRAEERQALAQADSLDLLSIVADRDLAGLLSDFDVLSAFDPPYQPAMLSTVIDPLGIVLDIVEEVLGESSVQVGGYPTLASPPTIQQLANKAQALVTGYAGIESGQLREQLESTYQQRRLTYSAVELPLNLDSLDSTIGALESWLAGR